MKGTLKLRTASLAAAAVMAAGLFAALPAAAETSTPETAQEDSGVPYDVANGLENSFRYKDGVPIYDDSVPAIEWEDIVCLLYTSPSPRDRQKSRMPSSA